MTTRTITFHTPTGDIVVDASDWTYSTGLWGCPRNLLLQVADAYGLEGATDSVSTWTDGKGMSEWEQGLPDGEFRNTNERWGLGRGEWRDDGKGGRVLWSAVHTIKIRITIHTNYNNLEG